jgi:hypothetical protein
MTPTTRNTDTRAARNAAKEERARDAALARKQYEAEKLAVLDKTARLRELRLAKEAAEALLPKPKKPLKKAS